MEYYIIVSLLSQLSKIIVGIISSYMAYSTASYSVIDIINNKNIKNDLNVLKSLKLHRSDGHIYSTTNINEIKSLVETLESNFMIKDLYNMYTNLSNLEIKYGTNIYGDEAKPRYGGRYDIDNNDILIYLNEEYILSHEFLHLVSTNRDTMQSGFTIELGNHDFGEGINEGYTEVLNQRYFKTTNEYEEPYKVEQKIASLIEKTFKDKKEMELLYLHNDLNGLINHLSKFMEYNDVIKLINDIDKISKLSTFKNIFFFNEYQKLNNVVTKKGK